ncbi:unnamed protein product [Ambrosiozyma monospora]|uniref:Unnamed protein product n=1 Tax=Ambrosiozyma monospora TaxID=43982 RepID=A0A9W7DJ66_AMBMO|nr:unnamed protein product [Ambrosiozyma monospora]
MSGTMIFKFLKSSTHVGLKEVVTKKIKCQSIFHKLVHLKVLYTFIHNGKDINAVEPESYREILGLLNQYEKPTQKQIKPSSTHKSPQRGSSTYSWEEFKEMIHKILLMADPAFVRPSVLQISRFFDGQGILPIDEDSTEFVENPAVVTSTVAFDDETSAVSPVHHADVNAGADSHKPVEENTPVERTDNFNLAVHEDGAAVPHEGASQPCVGTDTPVVGTSNVSNPEDIATAEEQTTDDDVTAAANILKKFLRNQESRTDGFADLYFLFLFGHQTMTTGDTRRKMILQDVKVVSKSVNMNTKAAMEVEGLQFQISKGVRKETERFSIQIESNS